MSGLTLGGEVGKPTADSQLTIMMNSLVKLRFACQRKTTTEQIPPSTHRTIGKVTHPDDKNVVRYLWSCRRFSHIVDLAPCSLSAPQLTLLFPGSSRSFSAFNQGQNSSSACTGTSPHSSLLPVPIPSHAPHDNPDSPPPEPAWPRTKPARGGVYGSYATKRVPK
jgi:hypothetical protein